MVPEVSYSQIQSVLLNFFRINDPYRLLGLLVLFFLISLPVFFYAPGLTWPELTSFILGEKITDGFIPYVELIEPTPLLTQWMYGLMDWLAGRSLLVRHILAFFILFLQACYISFVFINKKAFTENTYVPSLLFILLCAISFDVLAFTGTLLASGFLLLAINLMFKEIEFREQQDEPILKLGICLGLASLAEFSFMIFFVGAQLILILFTRASLRKHLLMLTGFLLPHILLVTWAFYFDTLPNLWSFFYQPNFSFNTSALLSLNSLFVLASVPLFYFVISFLILNRAVRLTNYQSQLLQAMIVWFLVGVVHLFFSDSLRPQSFLPLFPPLCFLLAHFLLAIRRRRFAEFHIWMFALGILITSNGVRFGYFESITYDQLLVKIPEKTFEGKKVLLLGNDPSVYAKNKLATGFYNWSLTQEIFMHPDYYENVLLVQKQFADELPEIIIDPNNLMKPFFSFLPQLKQQYTQKGNSYLLDKK